MRDTNYFDTLAFQKQWFHPFCIDLDGRRIEYIENRRIVLWKERFMSTIMPKGENLRQAVKWISSERSEDEHHAISGLIQEASLKFNLSPKEEEFLYSFYKKSQ